MAKNKEKRRYVRFGSPFCVELGHPDFQQRLSGVMKDISFSGSCVLVDTPNNLPAGHTVTLSMLFPDRALNVKAKIIWQKKISDKNKIGISFVNLPDYFKEDIYQSIFKYNRDEITSRWWEG